MKTLNVWLGAIILCGFVHVVSGRESGTSIDCTGTISDSICHEWHNSLKPKGIEGSVLTLAVDGASNYTLLLSENPTSQDQKAAEELQFWLKHMTGATLAIVKESWDTKFPSKIISVGHTQLLKKSGLTAYDEDMEDEGYGMDHPFLSEDFLKKSTLIFNRAETLAESEQVLARVQTDRLPIMYVKLMQGPEIVGDEYGKVLLEFERIARKTEVTHLREGGPDLDEKLNMWRAKWIDYQGTDDK